MINSRYLVGIVVLTLCFSGALRAATPLNQGQTWGAVQQWAPGANVIKVDGVTYRTGQDFQVLDRKGRKLPLRSVRLGTKVMVLSVDGVALQVIVDPGPNMPFDQPLR